VTEALGGAGEKPAVIEQLNLAYDMDQDRLLFKVGLSDNTELAVWLTRRITKSIWIFLQGSQIVSDTPVQVFTINAQGGLEEAQPKLMTAAQITPAALLESATKNVNFQTEYQANRTPRFAEPILANACRVLTDDPTQFVLELSSRAGQVVNIALTLELKIGFGNMLQLASKEAAWDVGLQASHFVAPPASAAQVFH
jgi:hypothetical protein